MKRDNMRTSNYKGIPAMSPPEVHQYLTELGRQWTGQGVALEAGCWLGATSAALLDGLVEVGYDQPFWAFDRWSANEAEIHKAKEQGVELKMRQNLISLYYKNVTSIYQDINATAGRIPQTFRAYDGAPIEICIFDAPKRNPTFRKSIEFVGRYFIPGVTVLGLMDYYFYLNRQYDQLKADWEKFLAPVRFMKKHKNHFTELKDFRENGSCKFFRYEKPISWKQ
jgi:hypothetical protein